MYIYAYTCIHHTDTSKNIKYFLMITRPDDIVISPMYQQEFPDPI